jgi:hypothetical protein
MSCLALSFCKNQLLDFKKAEILHFNQFIKGSNNPSGRNCNFVVDSEHQNCLILKVTNILVRLQFLSANSAFCRNLIKFSFGSLRHKCLLEICNHPMLGLKNAKHEPSVNVSKENLRAAVSLSPLGSALGEARSLFGYFLLTRSRWQVSHFIIFGLGVSY